jgi:hypothetical protein
LQSHSVSSRSNTTTSSAISSSLNAAQPTTPSEPFVDQDVAAKFLSVKPRRLLELARAGKIPAFPLGDGERRVWRFKISLLAAAMESRLNCTRQSPAPKETE